MINVSDKICRENQNTHFVFKRLKAKLNPIYHLLALFGAHHIFNVSGLRVNEVFFSVDMKNQLDVTFCILYFSSNSCSTCFGQPCAHHQELTTA